jgi:hypothetical protein
MRHSFKKVEKVEKILVEEDCSGINIQLNDDKTLYTLHFADDQVVVAQDKKDLEFMTVKLIREYEEWGLVVNRENTKYLCVGQGTGNLDLSDGETIGTCNKYTYLRMQVDNIRQTENEVEQRILKGGKVIGCLNSIL